MDKSASGVGPIRYAVRQVLDQELKKEKILQSSVVRQARSGSSISSRALDENKENERPANKGQWVASKELGVKRDFFGRIISEDRPKSAGKAANEPSVKVPAGRIWVSFHEGFSNAVRKPITLKELMDGF
jgi:chromosome transmission fidelity protein 18